MEQNDSYCDFAPLRQSSQLTEEAVVTDGTVVFENNSVIWPTDDNEVEQTKIEAFEVFRNEIPKATMCGDSLATTVTNHSSDEIKDEQTIWLSELDKPFSFDATSNANNQSMFEAFHSNTGAEHKSLNDTLPMEDGEELGNDSFWKSDEED